jgi:hypothetical protein
LVEQEFDGDATTTPNDKRQQHLNQEPDTMTTQADMDKLAARLAGLVGSELSIADQVRIDVLLYDVGETIRKLLIENKLCDMWAPR